MRQRIAIIGAGSVGTALASGLTAAGHDVAIGVREPNRTKYQELRAHVVDIEAAVADATVVVLAIPMDSLTTAVPALRLHGGHVVVDATNAVGAPVPHGFDTLGHFVGSMLPPEVALAKAFNTVGAEHLTGGTFGHATFLPIAGDETATAIVAALATDLGFEVADLGGRESFELVEDHARLWIHLAIRRGWGRDFAWSVVRR